VRLKLVFVLVIGLSSSLSVSGQTSFLKGTELGLTYSSIKAWRSPINTITINSQRSVNPVKAYSVEFVKSVLKNGFVKIQYSFDVEDHSDLLRRFINSTYFVSVGYKLMLDEINEFRPRIGWGIINRANYGTAITQIQGRPDTRSVIHYYYGKEPFTNWSLGMDYRHNMTDSIIIGIGIDVTYNFKFRDGRTYISPFIGYRL